MPKKASTKKPKRVFRSKEEIQRIVSEVSAAQAAGSKLTASLKELNVPYNSYNKWAKKFGKSAEAPVPVAKKITAKAVASKKATPGRVRFTPEQKGEMRERDKALKAEGKSDREVAKILGIAMPTLYRMRQKGKVGAVKTPSRATGKLHVQLSPDNPMYQLAVAHERLMAMNTQIGALTADRDKLAAQMREMMEQAAEVCPGLKGKK